MLQETSTQILTDKEFNKFGFERIFGDDDNDFLHYKVSIKNRDFTATYNTNRNTLVIWLECFENGDRNTQPVRVKTLSSMYILEPSDLGFLLKRNRDGLNTLT